MELIVFGSYSFTLKCRIIFKANKCTIKSHLHAVMSNGHIVRDLQLHMLTSYHVNLNKYSWDFLNVGKLVAFAQADILILYLTFLCVFIVFNFLVMFKTCNIIDLQLYMLTMLIYKLF
jgi:hypothetical protein